MDNRPPTDKASSVWYAAQPKGQYHCLECPKVDREYYVQPQHPFYSKGATDPRNPNGLSALCADCIDRHNREINARRKAELAARPKDCMKCGARPHKWIVAGYKLCGRCKTEVMGEHHRKAAGAGFLGLLGGPMFSTKDWNFKQEAQ